MTNVRALCVTIAVGLLTAVLAAGQTDVSGAVKSPRWTLGLFGIGGTGLYQDSNVQMFGIGGRLGRVLTHEHGPGFLRGTFEWDAEVLPFYQFYYDGSPTTGAVINPLVAKWNFTKSRKVPIFLGAMTGVIFTTKDFPPGDTSSINFNSGAVLGTNIFTREKRSISFDVRALHISNASLGNHNQGVNVSLQFSVGYNWWK